MARPAGTKVVKCPTKRCKGRIVAQVGQKGRCVHCNTELKITKKLLKDLGKI